MPWLPEEFEHPVRVDLPSGQPLRPIRAAVDDLLPRWLAGDRPLRRRRLVGRDLGWAEWIALRDR